MNITKAAVPEYVDVTLVARVWAADGVNLATSDFDGTSDWDLEVYDEKGVEVFSDIDASNAADDGVLIKNTLVTDGYWGDKDSTGYNFIHTVTQTQVSMLGGKTYRFVMRLNTTSHGVIPLAWDIEFLSLRPVT